MKKINSTLILVLLVPNFVNAYYSAEEFRTFQRDDIIYQNQRQELKDNKNEFDRDIKRLFDTYGRNIDTAESEFNNKIKELERKEAKEVSDQNWNNFLKTVELDKQKALLEKERGALEAEKETLRREKIISEILKDARNQVNNDVPKNEQQEVPVTVVPKKVIKQVVKTPTSNVKPTPKPVLNESSGMFDDIGGTGVVAQTAQTPIVAAVKSTSSILEKKDFITRLKEKFHRFFN